MSERDQPPSEPTLDALLTEVACTLGITSRELNHWAKETKAPEDALKLILRTAKRYQFNRLLGEIDW
jgi:hypothetical protein